jgi:hypothetical protein
LSDGDLPYQQVVTSLTGNSAFPNPPVPLPDVTAANDDYERKRVAAEDGTR